MQPTGKHIDSDALLIANRVRAMMEKHNIGKRQHAGELCDVLNLSFSAASRKMKGEIPWALEQIKTVALHFGEDPGTLLDGLSKNNALTESLSDAVLIIDFVKLPCQAKIGEEISPGDNPKLVAIYENKLWRIHLKSSVLESTPMFHVHLIEIRQSINKSTIAVVDDSVDSADALCDFLEDHGFQTTAFYNLDSFRNTIKSYPFDAYILDWLMGKDTSLESIKDIRSSTFNPHAPIFLLTGQLVTGRIGEDELARISELFNVNAFEKPTRPVLLSSALKKSLSEIAAVVQSTNFTVS